MQKGCFGLSVPLRSLSRNGIMIVLTLLTFWHVKTPKQTDTVIWSYVCFNMSLVYRSVLLIHQW